MNYYEHHLGDYMRDTAHLSWLEDCAYRRLLDVYYVRERALPADIRECCKLARAVTKPERDAVSYVLAEFFEQHDDGCYHQKRADEEIQRYQDKQAKAKRSADARWTAHRAQSEGNANAPPNAMRTHSERSADGMHRAPVPRHQSPDTKELTGGGVQTSPDVAFAMHPKWAPSTHVRTLVRQSGLDPPDENAMVACTGEFVLYWCRRKDLRTQADWDLAFVKSLKADQVRRTAGGGNGNGAGDRQTHGASASARRSANIAELTGRGPRPPSEPPPIDGDAERVG